MFPSYRNQSAFYMMGTLVVKELTIEAKFGDDPSFIFMCKNKKLKYEKHGAMPCQYMYLIYIGES